MSSLELTVAVQEQLPITYIVLNDSALGMVRHGQLLSGAESIACEIPTVRFNDIATACGAEAMPIASFSDLANIPQRMLGSAEGGPCLIDVQIDRNAIPPIAERLQGLKAVS